MVPDKKYETIIPTFAHDCSVYGGNSGGPLLRKDIVWGMPATYFIEPSQTNGTGAYESCYEKYWDLFFKPILNSDKPQASEEYKDKFSDWDQLDRNSEDISRFPRAIPVHLIVEKSAFLKDHPEYVH